MSQLKQNDNSYQKYVIIDTNVIQVFEALTTNMDKWWAKIEGSAQKKGDVFKISFNGNSYWKFKVTNITEFSSISWKCIASHQNHNINGMDEEWLDSTLHWEIKQDNDLIQVHFLHQGLVPHGICYNACSSAWDFYITDSLKRFLEHGEGKPEFM
ncbi:hypothetical protein [Aquimarina sp. AU119]|uniref:hypothetical protein n=1 Tax=Aquimarina sp. AU119 TaxID=2108528 RepID=UPI000D688235|nr:hypothetical protein [Aquimarina sp. AU119]